MKTGKITNSVISRSVLKNIKPAKNSLAVKPSIGADASVLENGIVIASDSGFEPVYTASNNIYARGGRPQYIQCCVNLAQQTFLGYQHICTPHLYSIALRQFFALVFSSPAFS